MNDYTAKHAMLVGFKSADAAKHLDNKEITINL